MDWSGSFRHPDAKVWHAGTAKVAGPAAALLTAKVATIWLFDIIAVVVTIGVFRAIPVVTSIRLLNIALVRLSLLLSSEIFSSDSGRFTSEVLEHAVEEAIELGVILNFLNTVAVPTEDPVEFLLGLFVADRRCLNSEGQVGVPNNLVDVTTTPVRDGEKVAKEGVLDILVSDVDLEGRLGNFLHFLGSLVVHVCDFVLDVFVELLDFIGSPRLSLLIDDVVSFISGILH